MVPGRFVLGVIEQCVRKRIPVASIYSDGFAETGEEGRKLQERLVETARAGGMRLTGPNCMGTINTHMPCALSINAVLDIDRLIKGSIGLVSQSGSVMGALLSRGQARGVGFSKLVSVGNECDLSVGEIVDILVDDADTRVIMLFLETIRKPELLARAARRAHAAGKPVVAYKLGRSDVARELAASHTGAMTGSDDSANAFFRRHGIIRVDTLEAMIELPQFLLGRNPPKGKRIAVLTTTGGGAAMVVDNLGRLGLDVVPPTDRIIANLAAKSIRIHKAALTDLTMAGTRKEIYSAVLGELLHSDHCDAVLAVVGIFESVPSAACRRADRRRNAHAEADGGIPGARCRAFIGAAARRRRCRLSHPGIVRRCDGRVLQLAHRRARSKRARDVQRAQGLLTRSPRAATERIRGMRSIRAARSARGALAHHPHARGSGRSRVSGRRKDSFARYPAQDRSGRRGGEHRDTRAAAREPQAKFLRACAPRRPNARIDGILVQEMKKGRAELIVGYKRDPQVGPVIVLGVGGTLAEIYRDYCVRIAPVTLDEAHEMIGEVKGLATIRGYRGQPQGRSRRARACAVRLLFARRHARAHHRRSRDQSADRRDRRRRRRCGRWLDRARLMSGR